MKWKNVLSTLMLVFLLALTLIPVSVVQSPEAYGPGTPKMFIKNYETSQNEFLALETGEIDIVDWPLSGYFIDRWTLGPDGIPGTGDEWVYNGVDPSTDQIRLDDYSGIDMFEYDIYNQRWPTGVGDRPEDALTYDEDTGTYKHYFDPTNQWDLRAWQFRLAIMYLVDKDYIQTAVLQGYGMMMDTIMPPAISSWLDIANLTNSHFTAPYGGIEIPSLIYSKNVNKAQLLLDAAGFTMITSGPNAGKRQDPRKPVGEALDPLVFFIRSDHIERWLAGQKLANDLVAIGVPVDARAVVKTVAWRAVMIDYNYHLYTGNWGDDLDIGPDLSDWLSDLYHSGEYWGAPAGSINDGTQYDIGWSRNYPGFAMHEFDDEAERLKYATTLDDIMSVVLTAPYIFAKYVPTIPLWSSAGVKGYRTGWVGAVNMFGQGVDNGYSFLNMKDTRPQPITTHPPGYEYDTLVLGFKSNAEGPSVVTAQWTWDKNMLSIMYDTLIALNPYNPYEDWPWLATDWDIGEWMYMGASATRINFTLRQNAYWHHGGQVTPDDIAFSIRFTRDAGPGVAWNYLGAMDVDHVTTWDNRAAGGGWGVVVYFDILSVYALHFVGWLPMFSKAVWMAASAGEGFGYTEGDPGTFVDRMKVREYHPWEDNYYNVGAGKVDLAEDGSGPWIWVGADLLLMEWYELAANPAFFLTQAEVENMLADAFWKMGDVNRDGQIDSPDMLLIARALYTTPADDGIPGQWWAWNPDADLNGDGIVDNFDSWIAGANFGMSAGGLYAGEPSNHPAASSSTISHETASDSLNPASASSDTVVYLDPLKSMALPDTTFTVNITIANVKNLFGWRVKLSWNPALLKVIRVQEGPFLKELPGTTFLTTRINNTVGYAWIGVTGTGRGFRGVYGSGTLANVTFSVKSKGRCTLDLSNTTLTDPWIPHPWWYNPLISHTAEDGYFRSTLLGDVAGPLGLPDGTVDVWDLRKLGISYGLKLGNPNWDPNADVTGPAEVPDGIVDLWDLTAVAEDYGKSIDP